VAPGRGDRLSTNKIDLVRSRRESTSAGVHVVRPEAEEWSVSLTSQNARTREETDGGLWWLHRRKGAAMYLPQNLQAVAHDFATEPLIDLNAFATGSGAF
jgi:hypothetical protein